MQNGFIDFVDIKLQSAEQTRYRAKAYLDHLYRKLLVCEDFESLCIRRNFLSESIWTAFNFGLIDSCVRDNLLKCVNSVYASRSDELRKENKSC